MLLISYSTNRAFDLLTFFLSIILKLNRLPITGFSKDFKATEDKQSTNDKDSSLQHFRLLYHLCKFMGFEEISEEI